MFIEILTIMGMGIIIAIINGNGWKFREWEWVEFFKMTSTHKEKY